MDDKDFDEIESLFGYGKFEKVTRRVLLEIEIDDWLEEMRSNAPMSEA